MKNVLITGGSRGIGAECVRLFSEKGYRVFFIYKSSVVQAEKLSAQTRSIAIKGDVTSFDDMKYAADIIHRYGKLDILINNAGIAQIKMFQDISEQDWDDMFNVNIKSMYISVKTFMSDMIEKKCGRIINISSIWGETGGSCEVHYSASKAAVIGFTKALAKELGPSGITVNCISPGVIETDMNKNIDDEEMEILKEETPLCRLGSVKDVANTVLFAASDEAGFITGSVIGVNGGLVI